MAEKEYIERNNVISHKRPFTEFDEGGWSCKVQAVAVEDIQNIPAADVEPVKHAKWAYGKRHGQTGYYCSECGTGFADTNPNAELIAKSHNYCPKCGAKMDGDTK